jgi:hypothetical protein
MTLPVAIVPGWSERWGRTGGPGSDVLMGTNDVVDGKWGTDLTHEVNTKHRRHFRGGAGGRGRKQARGHHESLAHTKSANRYFRAQRVRHVGYNRHDGYDRHAVRAVG